MARILAVDDEQAMLQLIRRVLEKDGHACTLVSDAAAVLNMNFSKYDLILLDVMMPGVDGFSLCRQIRSRVDCPILFLTAKTQENDIVQGLGFGADDYITVADAMQVFNAMGDENTIGIETKKKVRTVLNQILRYAIDENIISKNPLEAYSFRIRGKESEPTKAYTVEQMQYTIEHLRDIRNENDRNYMCIQSLHPMRPEEVLGLRWQDIDLESNAIHIRNTVTHPDRSKAVFQDCTKTRQSRRTLALVPDIKRYLTVGEPEDFVVGGKKPYSYTQMRQMRKRVARDIQFDDKITPRRFRTTVLTDIYDGTKDIKMTQAAAGHTTSAMTLEHYAKGRMLNRDAAKTIADAYGLTGHVTK